MEETTGRKYAVRKKVIPFKPGVCRERKCEGADDRERNCQEDEIQRVAKQLPRTDPIARE